MPMLGGLISERSGVLNIGLEGMMLIGAFARRSGDLFHRQSLARPRWRAHLRCVLRQCAGFDVSHPARGSGGRLRGDQPDWRRPDGGPSIPVIWDVDGLTPSVAKIPTITVPFLSDLPTVGRIFRSLSLVDYGCFVLIFLVWWVLFRTDAGLRLRACGESAESADAAGIPVIRTRFLAVMMSGVFGALGGAYLSIVTLDMFQASMTQGRGFLALAAMVFGKWRVWPGAAACLAFGFADAIALRAQILWRDIPHELLIALPYLLALFAMATFVGRASGPGAVGKPFTRA